MGTTTMTTTIFRRTTPSPLETPAASNTRGDSVRRHRPSTTTTSMTTPMERPDRCRRLEAVVPRCNHRRARSLIARRRANPWETLRCWWPATPPWESRWTRSTRPTRKTTKTNWTWTMHIIFGGSTRRPPSTERKQRRRRRRSSPPARWSRDGVPPSDSNSNSNSSSNSSRGSRPPRDPPRSPLDRRSPPRLPTTATTTTTTTETETEAAIQPMSNRWIRTRS
mmetsp:Transcript_2378/g.6372  ORF Transcript_2378/g.6372 Transcript_2378/m.6372 type:complete len:223 (+) Transcript_2378:410-1078(+)